METELESILENINARINSCKEMKEVVAIDSENYHLYNGKIAAFNEFKRFLETKFNKTEITLNS